MTGAHNDRRDTQITVVIDAARPKLGAASAAYGLLDNMDLAESGNRHVGPAKTVEIQEHRLRVL